MLHKYFKPLALTSVFAVSLLLASCGDKPADQANTQPAAEQQAPAQELNLETFQGAQEELINTPSHLGIPEGVVLADEQVLRYNQGSEPETIDPSKSVYNESFKMIQNSFDTLVRKARDEVYVPLAATSWETSADGLTWTFHLRPEAKWQDGKPVTAKDFVYSWQRLVDPNTAAPYADYLSLMNVVNANEVVAGKVDKSELGVKAVDDYTLEIHLTQPTPWLVQMVSLAVLVPLRQDIIEQYGDKWTLPEHYVGNGVFKLVKNALNDQTIFEKDENYWGAKDVAITRIEFDYIKNNDSYYLGFISGKYPLGSLSASNLEKAYREHPNEIYTQVTPAVYYYTFNMDTVTDVKVRKAFALLLDRETILYKVLKNHTPAYQFVPSSIKESDYVKPYDWKDLPQSERVAQANQLLAEAGYSKDKPLKLRFPTSDVKENKTFIALNSLLEQTTGGVLMLEPVIVEGKALFDLIKDRTKFDILVQGWNPDYDHISTYTSIFTCKGINNRGNYCNPEYDAILQQASKEMDEETRKQLYGKAVDIITNDYAIAYFFNPKIFFLKQSNLKGFNKDNSNRYFQDYYFVKEAK